MLELVRSDSPGGAWPSLTGTWRSMQTAAGMPLDIEFTASERDGEVSGHDQFGVGGARGVPFALSGTHEHPQVRFVLHASGVEQAALGGTFVAADAVRVFLSGSGFGGLPLLLKRY